MNQFPGFLGALPVAMVVLVHGIVHGSLQIADVIHRHFEYLGLLQFLVSCALERKTSACEHERGSTSGVYLVSDRHEIFEFVETFIDAIATLLFDARLSKLDQSIEVCQ